MLVFKPIPDRNDVEQLFHDNGLAYSAHSMAFSAGEGDASRGVCLFDVDGLHVYIHRVLCPLDKPDLAEGLMRAALNCAGGRGAYLAHLEALEFAPLALAMGFEEKEHSLTGEIPEILLGSCQNFGKKRLVNPSDLV